MCIPQRLKFRRQGSCFLATDNSEERHLYSFTLSTINEAQNLAFHYSGFQNSKNRGVGKLGFNFLLLKRRDFIVLSTQLFLWTSPSHMETYLGWGAGAVPSTLEDGYTRVRAEINQSKTTSVRILSLALVISCLHFKGCVIFNLIISHLKRVSFSLLKNHWD